MKSKTSCPVLPDNKINKFDRFRLFCGFKLCVGSFNVIGIYIIVQINEKHGIKLA